MQSTRSFFPEKTITLGSLIGLVGASATHPSFRQTLGTIDDTSSIATGSRRLINCFTRRRNDTSGPSTNKISSSWSNLIRCGSCRGSYDYPDDNSSIGAPPSLGHFLDEERELDSTNDQAKVYNNVIFEEDPPGIRTSNGINPLFDLGHVSSHSVINLLNNSLPESLPVMNNIILPAYSTGEKANKLQKQILKRSFNDSEQNQFAEQTNGVLRMHDTKPMQKARISSKSRSRRNQRRQPDAGRAYMPSCVSYMWAFSKNTADAKDNQCEDFEDVDSHCSSDESTSESQLESRAPPNCRMSCFTNYSCDDSDCSIFFDDEEVPYLSDSIEQNTTTSSDREKCELFSQAIDRKESAQGPTGPKEMAQH